MKHHPTKRERITPNSVREEVCLRSGGRWNPESNICVGGQCEICHGKKMDIRGLKFMHLKRRKMGGTTSLEIHSIENFKRACYVCDEENDGVRLPKSEPVDRPAFHLAGMKVGFSPFSKEMQTGIKNK